MSGYCLTPQADADLDELWWHVASAGGPPAADKLEDELHDLMERQAHMPGMGHLRSDLCVEPLRFFPLSRFLVIYRFETNPLQVIRVLHSARDVRAILESEADG